MRNGAKVEVFDLFYNNEKVPRRVNLPGAIAVQFFELYADFEPFFQEYRELFKYQLYVLNGKSQVVTAVLLSVNYYKL